MTAHRHLICFQKFPMPIITEKVIWTDVITWYIPVYVHHSEMLSIVFWVFISNVKIEGCKRWWICLLRLYTKYTVFYFSHIAIDALFWDKFLELIKCTNKTNFKQLLYLCLDSFVFFLWEGNELNHSISVSDNDTKAILKLILLR